MASAIGGEKQDPFKDEGTGPFAIRGSAVGEGLKRRVDHELVQVTRPDGLTMDVGYDSAGRLLDITAPHGAITYTYDVITGQRATVNDADGGVLSYTWDGPLLEVESLTGAVSGSVGFGYDNNFWLTSQDVNSSFVVTFAYDDDGLLTAAGAESLTRDADTGQVTGTSLGDIDSALTWSGFAELTSLDYDYLGTSMLAFAYSRDDLGRITGQTETVGGTTTTFDYDYDQAGRLVAYEENGVVQAEYDYDDNGNRTQTNTAGGTTLATYDSQDRLVGWGDLTFTYTDAGELESRTDLSTGDVTDYFYDVLGNLREVVLPNGDVIEYVIDGRNRRVGKRYNGVLIQGLLYQDQLNPAAELDGSGNVVARFVYGTQSHVPDYMEKGGVTYRLLTDHLGSVRKVVDVSTGTIAQELEYNPWGAVLVDTNPGFQPFGFAGGLYDHHTALVRFGARDYDPEVGRWTAKDPIGFAGGDTNLYGYVLRDPVNLTDPAGQDPNEPFPTADDAARDWGRYYNPISRDTGREKCGPIRVWIMWSLLYPVAVYYYDEAVSGSMDQCKPFGKSPEPPSDYAGMCHTHGGDDPAYDNENFSRPDIELCRAAGGPCWLFTPKGGCKKYIPGVGEVPFPC